MSGTSPTSFSTKPPLILVADDDKAIRTLLCEYMNSEGYRVADVTNGRECLDAYISLKPDLVLLDALMPVMDGFTCCHELMQIARNKLALALANFDTESYARASVISKLRRCWSCNQTPW